MAKEKMMSSSGTVCYHGACMRCHSAKLIIIGLLILANQLWMFLSWGSFIGALLVLGGLVKLAMPYCPHCKP